MTDKKPKLSDILVRVFGLVIATAGIMFLHHIKDRVTWLSPQISERIPAPNVTLWIGFGALLGLYLFFYQPKYFERVAVSVAVPIGAFLLGVVFRFLLMTAFGKPVASVMTLFLHPREIGGASYWIGTVLLWGMVFLSLMFAILHLFGVTDHHLGNENAKHHRGRGLIGYDVAVKRVEAFQERNLLWGALHVPDEIATTHFAIAGATGSGKTLTIRLLMQSVLSKVGEGRDSRAIVYDAKQDILSILHGMKVRAPIVTLNPFDKRCAAWDMAKDITSPATAQQVATILIPEEKHSSSPFFSDAARALLTGVLVSFIQTAPGAWTFRDMLYGMRSTSRVKEILKRTKETEDLTGQYFLNDRTANDVMSTVATKLQRFQYIAAAWDCAEQKISLKEWLTDEYILVLGNDEATRTALDAVNRVIFKRLAELIIAQTESETRRTWVFLDELRQAGQLEGLSSLLTMGRSKGTCVVIGFQDIEGLAGVYGDKEAAEITGLCANKAFLRMDSPKTAAWASSVLGEREVLERRINHNKTEGQSSRSLSSSQTSSSSESYGISEHLVKRELVLPSEFLALPPTRRENGLTGYYLTPILGAYCVRITQESLTAWLNAPDLDVPNVIPRSEDDQYLKPWNEADYKRLRFSDSQIKEVGTRLNSDERQQPTRVAQMDLIQEGSVLRQIKR